MLVAQRDNAEIVCVDSMQVYRGMDIGTAKPSPAMRTAVPHHLLDLVEPGESFTAARWVEAAECAIAGIRARGRPVLLVAGTPFYLRGLLYGLFSGPSADESFRTRLRARAATEGLAVLHAELTTVDPDAAARIHPNDLKRIERALEVHHATRQPISALQRQWAGPPRHPFVAVGLRRSKEELSLRITARVHQMVAAGLVDEVGRLFSAPGGMSEQARAALGYAEIIEHLESRWTLAHAVERIKINTRRFAKSQRTWFRRFEGVTWIDVAADESPPAVAARVHFDDGPASQ